MKSIFLLLFFSNFIFSQSILGKFYRTQGIAHRAISTLTILSKGRYSYTMKNTSSGRLVYSSKGHWEMNGDTLFLTCKKHSSTNDSIAETYEYVYVKYLYTNNLLKKINSNGQVDDYVLFTRNKYSE